MQTVSLPPEENTSRGNTNIADIEQLVAIPVEEDSAVFHTSFPSSNLPKEQESPKRIFLDVCSEASRPLSTEVLRKGGDVLSIDILIHDSMDLLVFFCNC